MASIKWEYTVSFIFAIASVILLSLIFVQTQYSENYQAQLFQEIENVASAGFTLQDIPDSPLSENTLDEYSEVAERPLFFNARRPIEYDEEGTVEQAEQQALEDLTIRLIGIINTPDSVYALFHNPKAKPDESKFQRFKQGDDINGRVVKEIKFDRVIISSSESGTEEIKLAKPRVHKASARKHKKPHRTNPFNRKIKKKK